MTVCVWWPVSDYHVDFHRVNMCYTLSCLLCFILVSNPLHLVTLNIQRRLHAEWTRCYLHYQDVFLVYKQHARTPSNHALNRRGSHTSVDFTQPSAADSHRLQARHIPGWQNHPGWQHHHGWQHRPGRHGQTALHSTTVRYNRQLLRYTRQLCNTLEHSQPHSITLQHTRTLSATLDNSAAKQDIAWHSYRLPPPPCRTLRRERTHAHTRARSQCL